MHLIRADKGSGNKEREAGWVIELRNGDVDLERAILGNGDRNLRIGECRSGRLLDRRLWAFQFFPHTARKARIGLFCKNEDRCVLSGNRAVLASKCVRAIRNRGCSGWAVQQGRRPKGHRLDFAFAVDLPEYRLPLRFVTAAAPANYEQQQKRSSKANRNTRRSAHTNPKFKRGQYFQGGFSHNSLACQSSRGCVFITLKLTPSNDA